MSSPEVVTVSDARANLTETLKRFRSSSTVHPVIFGSHRRPEAVILPYDVYVHGATSGSVRQAVRTHARLISRLAAANSLSNVRVVGSVARGDDTEESDLDLVVTPGETTTTFDLAQFAADVELLVGRAVDVVSDRSLDPVRDARLLSEVTPL